MTPLSRLLRPPVGRRPYSSFFSSKPGGGRYFNSAKPPKAVVPTSQTHKSSASTVGSSSNIEQQSNEDVVNNEEDSSPSPSSPSSNDFVLPHDVLPHHQMIPMLSSKDFKLHQFFSLHRPLLLLGDPSSILASAPADISFLSPSDPNSAASLPRSRAEANPPDFESSIEADAEAAREVTRALMITRAGGITDWENTLRRLGLDLDQDAERVEFKVQMEQDWQDVVMDSVKRKRRKKMKKHKLKKRRRLTRASRLKDR